MMRKYEYRIAWGWTLDELEKQMIEISNIRNLEIDKEVSDGYDVVCFEHQWFKPVGSISYINSKYCQTMMRKK